jgi:hypothetical protein
MDARDRSVSEGFQSCFLGFLTIMMMCGQASAQNEQSDDWDFGSAVYLWSANITAEQPGGAESHLPFYKLLDKLQMAFMGGLEVRKNRWSMVVFTP